MRWACFLAYPHTAITNAVYCVKLVAPDRRVANRIFATRRFILGALTNRFDAHFRQMRTYVSHFVRDRFSLRVGKNKPTAKNAMGLFFGLPDRIRTYDLQSRSLTRYPTVPRVDMVLCHIIVPLFGHFVKKNLPFFVAYVKLK